MCDSPNRAARYTSTFSPYAQISIRISFYARWKAATRRKSPTRSQSGHGDPFAHLDSPCRYARGRPRSPKRPRPRRRMGPRKRQQPSRATLQGSRIAPAASHNVFGLILFPWVHRILRAAPPGEAMRKTSHLAPSSGSAEWGLGGRRRQGGRTPRAGDSPATRNRALSARVREAISGGKRPLYDASLCITYYCVGRERRRHRAPTAVGPRGPRPIRDRQGLQIRTSPRTQRRRSPENTS